ncbi:MAG TPA: hypothetical protein VER12_08780 [Polyangiaceae bacterium]|nr:hypothetical protein [Polyangiaceae bacterium]
MKTTRSPVRRRIAQTAALLGAAALAATLALPSAHAEKAASPPLNGSAWLIVTHRVENFDRWKTVFDSVAPSKRNYGWKQSNVLSIDGDKNNVMVMEEFGSIEKAKAFAASSELKSAMAKAGVASAPEIHFVVGVAHSQL